MYSNKADRTNRTPWILRAGPKGKARKENQGKCGVSGCEHFAFSRGVCSMHYQRWYRTQNRKAKA